MNVLFVTWDGPQVFYLESLFLPIFRRLAEHGWQFHVLQFTWGDDRRTQKTRVACAESEVPYRTIRVLRTPIALGSLLTAFVGASYVRSAIRHWNIDVIMPRSVLPVYSCMRAMRREKLPMLFDADGLPLDERVDFGGMAPGALAHRFLRDIEAQGVRHANTVLTRTSAAADILCARAGAGMATSRVHVVPNGRDAEVFKPLDEYARAEVRKSIGISQNAPLVVYTGSLGNQYCLPEMFALFDWILRIAPEARFLILTGSPDIAEAAARKYALIASYVMVRSVPPLEVPVYLASADLGLALRKPSFSMRGVAPIKLGEYLLCGVPVLASAGVGDTSRLSRKAGFLVNNINDDVLQTAAAWFVEQVLAEREEFRNCCREIGKEGFSLESTVESYRQALDSIAF